jgi:hypothetical protein
MRLLEWRVSWALLQVSLHLPQEVPLSEQTILRNPMVLRCWFVIPQVLEAWGVGVGHVEGEVWESIIYSVQLLPFKEVLQIVLHYWVLSMGCVLSPGCVSTNTVSECEDIFELVVLQSVWIHIHQSTLVSKSCIHQFLESFTWRVNASWEKWLF